VSFTINEGYVRAFSIELAEVSGTSCIFNPGGAELWGSGGNFSLPNKPTPVIVADRFTIISIAPAYLDFGSGLSSETGRLDFTLTGTLAGDTGEGSGDFAFSADYALSAGACVAHSDVRWSIVRVQ
jgi:hypothetical protein